MNMIKAAVSGAIIAAGFGTSAMAATLGFTVDYGNSSVVLTETGGGGALCTVTSCSVDANLASSLNGETFTLGDGIGDDTSSEFDFITFSGDGTTGFSSRKFDIVATLAFSAPSFSATGSGNGGAFLLAGFITAGTLTWTSMSGPITLADGSIVTVNFEGGSGLLLDGKADYTTSATVSLDYLAPVPLPAGGLLLLGGLGAFGAVRRKKRAA